MPQAKLTYGVEFTRNLGNFQNVKPRFDLTVDVDFVDANELNVIKDEIVEQVDAWLVKKVEELDAELRG